MDGWLAAHPRVNPSRPLRDELEMTLGEVARELGNKQRRSRGRILGRMGEEAVAESRRNGGVWGGKVNNSVLGVTCVVASPAERERGGSGGLAEALERGTPIVSENWIVDSIQKKEAQSLAAYDIAADVVPEGRGLPLDKLDPSEEAIETLAAEIKLAGKRAVYKDSKLEKDGGHIFEKDGIIYNCAFSLCDLGCEMNEFCIMQLIIVPENCLHLYYKRGPIGHDQMAEERVEDFGSRVNDAIKEFVRLFEEVTGNEFEPWEREKKFEKKSVKMHPLDMDVGIDVRLGGVALRQLGAAAAHCKLCI